MKDRRHKGTEESRKTNLRKPTNREDIIFDGIIQKAGDKAPLL
jgi:hypothetical protein